MLTLRASDPYEFKRVCDIGETTYSIGIIKDWLRSCEKGHSRCRRERTSRLSGWRPKRLVFVGSPNSKPVPRVCLDSELPQDADITYVTLSHCWGDNSIVTLTKRNIEAFQQSLPFDELPKSFQHAIIVTQELGIEYLWIDSLCIIQDSDSDWANESATMSSIYRHSYCTIAATGFSDGTKGLFVKRDPSLLKTGQIKITAKASSYQGLPSGSYYCLDDIWLKEIVRAPLNQRGWVFQERWLSPRIVHFGGSQVFWECLDSEACEMFPVGMPAAFTTNYKKNLPSPAAEAPHPDPDLLCAWCNAVSVYSGCRLKEIEKDRLVALSGIAAMMSQMLESKYVAGIWESGLPWHLLWFIGPEPGNVNVSKRIGHAPSWSWASVDGKVKFLDPKGNIKSTVKILVANTALKDNQNFGRVSGGFLRIRGRLCQAEFKQRHMIPQTSEWMMSTHALILKSEKLRRDPTLNLVICPDVSLKNPLWSSLTIEDALGNTKFFLLFLTRTQMLVPGTDPPTHRGERAISATGNFLLGIHNTSARSYRCRQDPQTCLGLHALRGI